MAECRHCGRENPDDARFCNACGQALASAPATRKTVTVVFCDVVGSTALGERLDPESVTEVMARYFEAMREAIERHGGTIEKFIGDAVMAVFGVPRLHEDDALRAVRAAVGMREAMTSLNAELVRRHGVTIDVRIGVNSGEVMAGGETATLVAGDPVNVAARLEAAAAAGQILIGEATYRLVREQVTCAAHAPIRAKGKAEGVLAHVVVDLAQAPPHVARAARIIGRDRELGTLRDVFRRVERDRRAALLTVLGAAGVGKSRLVGDFVASLGAPRPADAPAVAAGRCLPYGEGITYWPVAEAVRDLLDLPELSPPEEARRGILAQVAGDESGETIAARIAEVLGISVGAANAKETHWAVRRFFELSAVARPLVLVFDDVQWAEPTFLDLVDHLVEDLVGSADGAPVLVICMARPELLEVRPEWPSAATMHLGPLDPAGTTQLVESLLGTVEIDDDVRLDVGTAAEGNPLFVEQLLSNLVEDGLIVNRDGTWVSAGDRARVTIPPTIASLLSARLDRLAPDDRVVIEAAAVIGQQFSLPAVMALSTLGSEADLGDVLERLARKELIRPAPLRFGHLLIRDAAYLLIPKRRRADLHERFADWLEAGGHADELEEIMGYHLEQACLFRAELGPPTDHDRAVATRAATRLASAGYRALSRADMSATANLLARAAALYGEDDPDRVTALSELGYALAEAGQRDRGIAIVEQAIELAEGLGDEQLRAHGLVRYFDTVADADPHDDEIDRTIDDVIAVFTDHGDDRGLARAWRIRGKREWGRGQAGAYERALDRALVHARRARDQHDEAHIFSELGAVFVRGPIRVDAGIARCHEILAASRNSRAIEAYVCHPLAHLLARCGRFEEARESAETMQRFLLETGQLWTYWLMRETGCDVEHLAGDTARAVELMQESAGHLQELQGRNVFADAMLARYLYATGDADLAEGHAEYALTSQDPDLFTTAPIALGTLGKIRARQGRADEALRLAAEGAALLESTDLLIDKGGAFFDLGEVHELLGNTADARASYGVALDASERKGDLVTADRVRAAISVLQG